MDLKIKPLESIFIRPDPAKDREEEKRYYNEKFEADI